MPTLTPATTTPQTPPVMPAPPDAERPIHAHSTWRVTLGDRILILNSVRLIPEWRGFGLGILLAGTAIKKLSGGVRAAVCYPAPTGEPADGQPDSPAALEQAIEALSRAWAQLGFEHFRDGVHVLDLSLVTLDESLGRLHKRAEQHHRTG